jgi:hypothetical protein
MFNSGLGNKFVLIVGLGLGLSGCASLVHKPYSPVPPGMSISASPDGGYRLNSVRLSRSGIKSSPEALDFCFGQNIPGITGSPTFNPSKTKITAQGADQVAFIVPMAMGTQLNYELMFSVTSSKEADAVVFNFMNLKIRGTWSANVVPFPGTEEAKLYVESALGKFNAITDDVVNCLRSES